MGTRGLTAVVKDGDFRIAQYGQWDHYLSGQGQTVLDFFKSNTPQDLSDALNKVRWITEEEYSAGVASVGVDPDKEWITLEESNKIKGRFPHLTRDLGAKILQAVVDAPGEVLLNDQRNFAADSLFCEYAYVVDLDTGVFEVYEGFQGEPHTQGRFADLPREEYPSDNTYYPVRLIATYPLDALPDHFEEKDYPEDHPLFEEETLQVAVYADGTEVPLDA